MVINHLLNGMILQVQPENTFYQTEKGLELVPSTQTDRSTNFINQLPAISLNQGDRYDMDIFLYSTYHGNSLLLQFLKGLGIIDRIQWLFLGMLDEKTTLPPSTLPPSVAKKTTLPPSQVCGPSRSKSFHHLRTSVTVRSSLSRPNGP